MNAFISRYANWILVSLTVLFLLFWLFSGFSVLLFLLILFTLYMYRITKVEVVCTDEKAILAPVDGEIISIQKVEHKILGTCVELQIKNSFYEPGTIRACTDMSIDDYRLRYGLFGCEQRSLNERVFILAKNSHNKAFAMRIFAGCLDRALKLSDKSFFKPGEEMAFSMNSTISLLLPSDTRLVVGLRDKVKAVSLLGYFS